MGGQQQLVHVGTLQRTVVFRRRRLLEQPLEHRFDRFKALRAKSYCFEEGGELVVHCAGMPSRCHSGVTMENFAFGRQFAGKLRPKDVKGGTILVEDVFTIHE